MEQRAAIKFCFKLKKTPSETLELLQTAYGNECLSRSKVFEWYARFKAARFKARPLDAVFYKSVLERLLARIRRVRPNQYKSGDWFLLHDNAPAHTAILVAQFLAKRKVTVITHPPYSPDLAPADFFLFPKLKNAMKGDRFDDVPDIQRNVTRIMNSIPAEQFKRAFRHLYERFKNLCGKRRPICRKLINIF
ncbi:MOS1T transposase, partial [Acromyrmex insinuator]